MKAVSGGRRRSRQAVVKAERPPGTDQCVATGVFRRLVRLQGSAGLVLAVPFQSVLAAPVQLVTSVLVGEAACTLTSPICVSSFLSGWRGIDSAICVSSCWLLRGAMTKD